MNIAVFLKDKPKGFPLYSPTFGDVKLEDIDNTYIHVSTEGYGNRCFHHDGKYYDNGECMLFPSKKNRDWSTLITTPIFKKGDVIVEERSEIIAIFNDTKIHSDVIEYCCLLHEFGKLIVNTDTGIGYTKNCRLATKEEKERLYSALVKEGYFWNPQTEVVDKLKFKIGDTVKNASYEGRIVSMDTNSYKIGNPKGGYVYYWFQDKLKSVPDKFDITTLKPFDKVLVKRHSNAIWTPTFFGWFKQDEEYRFWCDGQLYRRCIPYNEETKHLIGTTDDCPEFYKTW